MILDALVDIVQLTVHEFFTLSEGKLASWTFGKWPSYPRSSIESAVLL